MADYICPTKLSPRDPRWEFMMFFNVNAFAGVSAVVAYSLCQLHQAPDPFVLAIAAINGLCYVSYAHDHWVSLPRHLFLECLTDVAESSALYAVAVSLAFACRFAFSPDANAHLLTATVLAGLTAVTMMHGYFNVSRSRLCCTINEGSADCDPSFPVAGWNVPPNSKGWWGVSFGVASICSFLLVGSALVGGVAAANPHAAQHHIHWAAYGAFLAVTSYLVREGFLYGQSAPAETVTLMAKQSATMLFIFSMAAVLAFLSTGMHTDHSRTAPVTCVGLFSTACAVLVVSIPFIATRSTHDEDELEEPCSKDAPAELL